METDLSFQMKLESKVASSERLSMDDEKGKRSPVLPSRKQVRLKKYERCEESVPLTKLTHDIATVSRHHATDQSNVRRSSRLKIKKELRFMTQSQEMEPHESLASSQQTSLHVRKNCMLDGRSHKHFSEGSPVAKSIMKKGKGRKEKGRNNGSSFQKRTLSDSDLWLLLSCVLNESSDSESSNDSIDVNKDEFIVALAIREALGLKSQCVGSGEITQFDHSEILNHNSQQFQMHAFINREQKIFICKTCRQNYASKTALTRHLKTHVCPFCNTFFTQKSDLSDHKWEHRSSLSVNSKSSSPLQYLSKFNRKTIAEHCIRNVKERIFRCQPCSVHFPRSNTLMKHMISHICKHCDVFHPSKKKLVTHIAIKHVGNGSDFSSNFSNGDFTAAVLVSKSCTKQGTKWKELHCEEKKSGILEKSAIHQEEMVQECKLGTQSGYNRIESTAPQEGRSPRDTAHNSDEEIQKQSTVRQNERSQVQAALISGENFQDLSSANPKGRNLFHGWEISEQLTHHLSANHEHVNVCQEGTAKEKPVVDEGMNLGVFAVTKIGQCQKPVSTTIEHQKHKVISLSEVNEDQAFSAQVTTNLKQLAVSCLKCPHELSENGTNPQLSNMKEKYAKSGQGDSQSSRGITDDATSEDTTSQESVLCDFITTSEVPAATMSDQDKLISNILQDLPLELSDIGTKYIVTIASQTSTNRSGSMTSAPSEDPKTSQEQKGKFVISATSVPMRKSTNQEQLCSGDLCRRMPFTKEKKLKCHLESQSETKIFRCKECGKSFKRNHTLKMHQSIHKHGNNS